MPMRSRSARPPVSGSLPSTVTAPVVRGRKPSRISTIVVLPAPFGPSSAKTSPSAISKLTPRTASTGPYDLCRSTTSTVFMVACAWDSGSCVALGTTAAPAPDLRELPCGADAGALDLAVGAQLEQVRVHLTAGHLLQPLG